jgi:Cu-Zn family superoxide dismutase
MDYGFFNATEKIRAVAVFQGQVQGVVYFEELGERVRVYGYIRGLSKGAHGFHIHESGDLTDPGCASACAHFNPFNKVHGCPGARERHVGDLGNIFANGEGLAKISMVDDYIQLRGNLANIIGRSLVVHEKQDDCGLGNNQESLKTGNAGARVGCAVIGYARKCA